MHHEIVITIIFSLIGVIKSCSIQDRENMDKGDMGKSLGYNIVLNEKEKKVSFCLSLYKKKDLNIYFDYPDTNIFLKHFFEYKDEIKESSAHSIIKSMPKGAVLHIHDTGMMSDDYVLSLTYMDHLYICFDDDDIVQLQFANSTPNICCAGHWDLVSHARERSANKLHFDDKIKKQFSLVVENPREVYKTTDDVWEALMKYSKSVIQLITYRPARKVFLYDALKSLYDSNIMYVEFRTTLPELYDITGKEYDSIECAKLYKEVIRDFKADYPDFYGAKIIYSPRRDSSYVEIAEYLEIAKTLKKEMPEIFAGFDLTGPEERSKPLKHFFGGLAAEAKEMPYFFHAAETSWNGFEADENVIDAVVLNSKRLGQSVGILKHPGPLKILLEKDIPVEFCVISNHVFYLAYDIRNNPASVFLANSYPLVLSSDSPGAYGADPINDDYYLAFLGAASKHADLRMLKQLFANSLKYATLTPAEKDGLIKAYNKKWDAWVTQFDCSKY